MDGWGGEKNAILTNDVEVRVFAWKQFLPRAPDFSTTINMRSQFGTGSYKRVAHNLKDSRMHAAVVRCTPTDPNYKSTGANQGFYFKAA